MDKPLEKIEYKQFEKIQILSGTIVKAEEFSRARNPSYKVWVDFGEIGTKQTSAQITAHYTKESLIHKKVMGCVNMGSRNIAGFQSEFLLLGFPDEEGKILLASVDSKVPNGKKLF